jgi:hypothetical protein
MANAYSFGQVLPVEVVTSNNDSIVDLIERDFGVSVGAGLIDQWTTVEKNVYDVFPLIAIDDPHGELDTPDPLVTEFVSFEGGTAYQTTQTYTAFVPTLDDLKAQGALDAAAKSLLFLDGGFFHDDGDGGGSVLFNSDTVDRADYSVIGVQANTVGTTFVFIIRDAGFGQHSWNSAQWQDFFNSFFNHVILARDDLEAALLAIDAAADAQDIQDALDNIPPPNNTV